MSNISRDRMRCSRCDGRGVVPLPPELQATLDLLRRSGPLTVAEAAMELRAFAGRTAINNRLEDLRRLGHASRTKVDGRRWSYGAVERPMTSEISDRSRALIAAYRDAIAADDSGEAHARYTALRDHIAKLEAIAKTALDARSPEAQQ